VEGNLHIATSQREKRAPYLFWRPPTDALDSHPAEDIIQLMTRHQDNPTFTYVCMYAAPAVRDVQNGRMPCVKQNRKKKLFHEGNICFSPAETVFFSDQVDGSLYGQQEMKRSVAHPALSTPPP